MIKKSITIGDYPMTASKLASLGRIIRDVARLRDMRRLVKLVKLANEENWEEYIKVADSDEDWGGAREYHLKHSWIEKEEAIRRFGDSLGGDEQKSRDIYGDATSKRYGYLRESDPHGMEKHVDATSDGRTLIQSWGAFRIPKEYIEKNFNFLTVLISLFGGIIIGAITAYILYKTYLKP